MRIMRPVIFALLLLPLMFFAVESMAQEYPQKPVKIIVHLPAGGSTDVIARLYGARLSTGLGKQFYIENRPGGGGTVAAREIAKSPRDGYSLGVCTAATNGIVVGMYDNVGYHPVRDFTFIGMMGGVPMVIAVRPDQGIASLQDLIKKSRQQSMNVALPNTMAMLVRDLIVKQEGAGLNSVPYKGAAAAINDVLGGHLSVIVDTPITIQPQVAAGKLLALGITTRNQTPLMAGVKTVAEQGFPGFEVTGWFSLCAPEGIPAGIVRQLNAELQKIHADPEFQKSLLGQGFDVVPVGDSALLPEFVRAESERWVKVVKDNNIRP